MTAGSRGRVAIAAAIVVVAFAAAFAVHKASAGSTDESPLPTPAVISSAPVRAVGVSLPAATLPALRRPPHRSAPAPTSSPTPSSTPAPSEPTPAAPPSGGGGGGGGSGGGGGGGGPVLVG